MVIMALECQVANARLLLSSTPDARLAETLDIKSGASLSERTPVNISRGIVEPFEGYAYPKGVAYAAGYIFILHESGQMYRCNISNQLETCYQQNKMYRDNAFNWIVHPSKSDYGFARKMAVEDDKYIITASGRYVYRCSTISPSSCEEIRFYRGDYTISTIAVGGGRIFAGFTDGKIMSFDIADGAVRVSLPFSMRRLSVWTTTSLRRVSTWEEGYEIHPQT
jgi:hypothetical protein